jgi:hypothetical protein
LTPSVRQEFFSGLSRHPFGKLRASYGTLNGLQGNPKGLWSPRESIESTAQEFKKSYIDEKFTASKGRKKIGRVGQIDAVAACQAEISPAANSAERSAADHRMDCDDHFLYGEAHGRLIVALQDPGRLAPPAKVQICPQAACDTFLARHRLGRQRRVWKLRICDKMLSNME